MPKGTIIRQTDGSLVVALPDGSRRPLPAELHREIELPLSQALNVQGVGKLERVTFKNLTESPETARAYLELRGYETRRLPPEAGAWNFAVRKSPKEPWKLVDPISGLDLQDIADLLADVAQGALVTAGAAIGAGAGGVGAIFGAGGAGAVGEFARQTAGQLAGVPQTGDVTQIALQGALGAASVPAGALIGAAGRGVAKLARGNERLTNAIIARISGVRNTQSRSMEEVLADRVTIAKLRRERISTFGRVDGAAEFAPRFIAFVDDLAAGQAQSGPLTTASRQLMLNALDEAQARGWTANIAPVVDDLIAAMRRRGTKIAIAPTKGRKVRVPLEPAMPTASRKALQNVLREVAESVGDAPLAQAPVRAVDGIIERLSRTFADARIPADAAQQMQRAIGSLEEALISAFDNAGMPEFRVLSQRFSATMTKIHHLRQNTLVGAHPARRHSTTAKFLRDLDSDAGAGFRRYLEEIQADLNLGDGFTAMIRDLTTSKGFGFRGEPQTLGALAATGGPRGLAFGAAIGGAAGGTAGGIGGLLPGALLGSAAGLALSLPRVGLAAAVAARNIRTGVQAIPRTLGRPGVRLVSPGALSLGAQPVADSAVVAQRPRRKQVRLGQF